MRGARQREGTRVTLSDEKPWVVSLGTGKVNSFYYISNSSISAPRPRPHRGGPHDAKVICTYIPVDRSACRPAHISPD